MARRSSHQSDPVKLAASQIRQIMPLFQTYGKTAAQLRQMAREYDVVLDEDASEIGMSAALSDAADSRIATIIQDAAKALGVSFEHAQELINEALGY